VTLTAVATDDGLPQPPDAADRRQSSRREVVPADGVPPNRRAREFGLRGEWYVYRLAGSVTLEPEQLIRPYPPGQVPPPLGKEGRFSVKATFGAPGTYVLRAMGDDMGLQTFQDVTITVVP